ncbi:Cullin 1 [Schizosaccharomyces japonicus yFS275]|uniref:Cullin 1 n=1 Tax=Schizosaccharomyces japonicus (strain yFS275 / FY16936) TaxID=402676 RepID=B6K0N3_SCHJY|nr:Cullin 1 [Schizosaccharomyces japonicus yFS275]EEB07504.2 Cullin 1 [Schizosaccharomyces japonicus yFS275]
MNSNNGKVLPAVQVYDNLNGNWPLLRSGIAQILEKLDDGMTIARYMELYTAIHNYCADASKTVSADSFGDRSVSVLGEALYNNLVLYLSKYLEQLRQQLPFYDSAEIALEAYAASWKKYTTAAGFLNHLFRYLNRYWVKLKNQFTEAYVYDVYTLCLVSWQQHIFQYVSKDLLQDLLRLFTKLRHYEPVDMKDVKICIESITSLSFDKTDLSKPTLKLYKDFFERQFLSATQTFYEDEAARFIQSCSVVDYMKKAETRLSEEEELVKLYLHESTLQPLLRVVENTLITLHASTLHEAFPGLLEDGRLEDVVRMYQLLSRTDNGLQPLRVAFEMCVRKSGLASVDNVVAATNPGEDTDPHAYLHALLSVYERYRKIVTSAFNGDSEFTKYLDNACREFINRNAVCKTSSSRSPELLARYTDAVLRRNSKTGDTEDIEQVLSSVMIVFRYVEDKDVFQKFYAKFLAKRLVNGTSTSEDSESSMLSKLKEACGFEYTNKLQRMIQDIGLSSDLTDAFHAQQPSKLSPIDFNILVLSTSSWPLSSSSTTFRLPNELAELHDAFQNFYQNKHSGRKLNWLMHLSKGEMKAKFGDSSSTTYILQVSTYQMGVLLLYNAADSYTFAELQQNTELSATYLSGILRIFLRAKILVQQGNNKLDDPSTVFALNRQFRSRRIRLPLNLPIKTEQKQESAETQKTIKEDRKLLLQSAIVRIMKARKTLKHVVLVKETIDQIKSRFKPEVADIKRCIDILIEKEYLERQGRDEYVYLA